MVSQGGRHYYFVCGRRVDYHHPAAGGLSVEHHTLLRRSNRTLSTSERYLLAPSLLFFLLLSFCFSLGARSSVCRTPLHRAAFLSIQQVRLCSWPFSVRCSSAIRGRLCQRRRNAADPVERDQS